MRQFIFALIFCALAATLIIGSLRDQNDSLPDGASLAPLSNFVYTTESGESYTTTLPLMLSDIPANTSFTLETVVAPGKYNSILIKTVFMHLRLFADDELIYESGQPGSYPAWMLDPPTLVKILNIPDTASTLRFEYVSPSQRNTVSLPVIMAGDEADLMLNLIKSNSPLLLISIFLLSMGIVLSAAAAIFLRRQNGKEIFVWLGLSALAFGLWGIGECDATQIFVPLPILLYFFAYTGMFAAVMPMLKFGLLVLKPRYSWPMKSVIYALYGMTVIAFSLQITGVMALSKTVSVFQILAPIGVATFTITILIEHFRYKNEAAKNFTAPGIVLLVAALLEVSNYAFRFVDILSLFSLAGTMVFILMLGIIGLWYIRETVQAAADKKRLEDQVRFTNRQIAIQREQYVGIAESVENAKKARHDLRHQLYAIRGFNEAGETERLGDYLEELISNIPMAYEKSICENFAVNAVAAHYIAVAESENIDVDAIIKVPDDTGEVPALDLCVILGNFLENAIDACRRMEEGDKFIRVWTRIDGDTLSFVVVNSYDGLWTERKGIYLSRKENRYSRDGIGISSVKAVCEKHRGLLLIEPGEDTWKASALIHM